MASLTRERECYIGGRKPLHAGTLQQLQFSQPHGHLIIGKVIGQRYPWHLEAIIGDHFLGWRTVVANLPSATPPSRREEVS